MKSGNGGKAMDVALVGFGAILLLILALPLIVAGGTAYLWRKRLSRPWLCSLMPENGVIFSDGIESDFLEFTSGITATISVADRVGHLVN